ncbi:hypothetical protein ACFL6N_05800 [Thermodesulfobacteriota bacterium]
MSIFTVKSLGQNIPNNIPITSGVTFGWVDKELVFELTMENQTTPLLIKFFLNIDKEAKESGLKIDSIKNNTLRLDFKSNTKSGPVSLFAPLSLLIIKDNILGLMFHIDLLSGSNCYRFSYEFYHGKSTADKGSK